MEFLLFIIGILTILGSLIFLAFNDLKNDSTNPTH